MTLQQLKYIIMVAETGTITEAASRLFISQPSLTNAIHELEKEMNITIFDRTNKGIHISKDGEDFLGYARQVLEQATLLEDRYKGGNGGKQEFCVSTQHYSFAVQAFVEMLFLKRRLSRTSLYFTSLCRQSHMYSLAVNIHWQIEIRLQ